MANQRTRSSSDTKLIGHDLIVTRPLVRGPITVALRAEGIVLNEDFFLATALLYRSGTGSREEPYEAV